MTVWEYSVSNNIFPSLMVEKTWRQLLSVLAGSDLSGPRFPFCASISQIASYWCGRPPHPGQWRHKTTSNAYRQSCFQDSESPSNLVLIYFSPLQWLLSWVEIYRSSRVCAGLGSAVGGAVESRVRGFGEHSTRIPPLGVLKNYPHQSKGLGVWEQIQCHSISLSGVSLPTGHTCVGPRANLQKQQIYTSEILSLEPWLWSRVA